MSVLLQDLPRRRSRHPSRPSVPLCVARRPVDLRLRTVTARPRPAQPPPTSRRRNPGLGLVLAVSVAVHVGLLMALGKLVIVRQSPPAPPVVLHMPVRILPAEGEAEPGAADGPAGNAAAAQLLSRLAPPVVARPASPSSSLPVVPVAGPFDLATDVIGVEASERLESGVAWTVPAPSAMRLGGETAGDGDGTVVITGRGDAGSGGRGRPSYLRNPRPSYPRVAAANGWQGTTVLRVEVSPEGRSGQVEIVQSSGYSILDQTAVDTVRRWRFIPARQNNHPVTAWVEVPIRFKLTNHSAG